MRDQRPEAGVAVESEQAGDSGVLGVVLLARRSAPPGNQIGIDRQHHEAGVKQGLHEQAVPGLNNHSDLFRVGLQPGDPPIRADIASGRCSTRSTSITPSPGRPSATRWKSSAQSIPTPSTSPSPLSSSAANTTCGRNADSGGQAAAVRGRRRAVLIDSPQGTATSWASGLQSHPPGTPSPLSPRRTSARSVPQGKTLTRRVEVSAPGWTNDLEAGPPPGSHWTRPGTAIGYVGRRAPCAGRVLGRLAAAFIPSGGARGWWPRGHGAVRVRAAGSIRQAAGPPVAGASKTSDHALPASGPAHAAFCELVARSRTWPSRIA